MKNCKKASPLAALVLLSACGSEPPPADIDASDPALSGALADQIMIDPDLVDQNGANTALAITGQDGSLPLPESGPAAIAAARAAAFEDVGGASEMRKAPPAKATGGSLPPGAELSVAARAAAAPGGNGDCAALAKYTAAWAARLPANFPVYPHGAVQEAAGTDAKGCSLRVVNFITPVPAGEVIDYYYTRAVKAGFSAQRLLQDGDDVLGGTRSGASYLVYVRPVQPGGTEVDLITSGR